MQGNIRELFIINQTCVIFVLFFIVPWLIENGKKKSFFLPCFFLLYPPATTTLATLLAPDVWVFSPHQAILYGNSWVSYNFICCWHFLTQYSIRSHRWRVQFHKTDPTSFQMPVQVKVVTCKSEVLMSPPRVWLICQRYPQTSEKHI